MQRPSERSLRVEVIAERNILARPPDSLVSIPPHIREKLCQVMIIMHLAASR